MTTKCIAVPGWDHGTERGKNEINQNKLWTLLLIAETWWERHMDTPIFL